MTLHDKEYSDGEVVALYLNHPTMKVAEIASVTRRSLPEVYRVLQAQGVEPNRLRVNHQHIHDYIRSGYTVAQVAELTGYTPRNVRYILSKVNLTEEK